MEPGELHANTRITPPGTFRVLSVPPALAQAARELAAPDPDELARVSALSRFPLVRALGDQSHFTHHFVRITGVTPGRYARG
jgi:hypothetical protein